MKSLLGKVAKLDKLINEVKTLLHRHEEEDAFLRLLYYRFKMGRQKSFMDDQGEEQMYIKRTHLTKLLTRKIYFGKSHWLHYIFMLIATRSFNYDEVGELEAKLFRRKLTQQVDDEIQIVCYQKLYNSILKLKMAMIDWPLGMQKFIVNLEMLSFIVKVKFNNLGEKSWIKKKLTN